MKKIVFILLLILTSVINKSYSQACDPGTPTFTMNLTGQSDSVWISPAVVRAQTCCALTANCIEFNVTLDINSVGIILNFASGAVPPGLLEYNANCGAPVVLGSPMSLSGVGPHRIVFCKPGNNSNQYSITAIPRNINIPDTTFKAALLANNLINTNLDGEIQVTEAATYTGNIDVSFAGISDLTGIEEFTAITYLDCNSNSLTSLDLSNNTALTNFYCRNNLLTSLDVSANTALTDFDCRGNQLTSLNVSANTALTDFDCRENQLTSLNVSTNTALISLICIQNQITSLDVSSNTLLINLYCDNNQLTSLDVSANTALAFLSCLGNQLTSLDVSTNTNLVQLNCGFNSITSLVVSANTSLTHIDCQANQLTSLDVSANTALFYLLSNNNLLTSMNIRNGNNATITNFQAANNPNLTCIQVDNVANMNAAWTAAKDSIANYSTNCAGVWCNATIVCSITVNSNAVSDGKLYLFKQNIASSRMDTIYTETITTNIHTFTNLEAGNYLVYYKANSVTNPNTPGTYNGNFRQWDLASYINLVCNTDTPININATSLTTYSGPGSISGRINEGGQFGKINVVGDPIPGVDITLEQNPGGIMLDQTTTNANGEYLFTNLPISNYRVLVNIPGTNQIAYQDVTITATFTSIVDVNYIVDSTEIYILSNEENLFHNSTESKFKVIPNPFNDKAKIALPANWINNNQELLITITDISGKLVYTKKGNSNTEVIINREVLENGMYFIKLASENKSATQKLIITD
ncbi:MAG: T9SS type A sorting domain-containing protein [Bacteroidota bacterium]